MGSSLHVFLHSGEIVVTSDSDYEPFIHLSMGMSKRIASKNLAILKAYKMDPFQDDITGAELCPVAAILN